MAKNIGTLVIQPIKPNDTADTYPTHIDEFGQGGHRSINTLVERNSIPIERQKVGMSVYVVEDGNIYILNNVTATLVDGDWDISDSFPEAPIDSNQYARKDAGWEQVAAGGVPEAPIDSNQYARKDAGWEQVAVEVIDRNYLMGENTKLAEMGDADDTGEVVIDQGDAESENNPETTDLYAIAGITSPDDINSGFFQEITNLTDYYSMLKDIELKLQDLKNLYPTIIDQETAIDEHNDFKNSHNLTLANINGNTSKYFTTPETASGLLFTTNQKQVLEMINDVATSPTIVADSAVVADILTAIPTISGLTTDNSFVYRNKAIMFTSFGRVVCVNDLDTTPVITEVGTTTGVIRSCCYERETGRWFMVDSNTKNLYSTNGTDWNTMIDFFPSGFGFDFNGMLSSKHKASGNRLMCFQGTKQWNISGFSTYPSLTVEEIDWSSYMVPFSNTFLIAYSAFLNNTSDAFVARETSTDFHSGTGTFPNPTDISTSANRISYETPSTSTAQGFYYLDHGGIDSCKHLFGLTQHGALRPPDEFDTQGKTNRAGGRYIKAYNTDFSQFNAYPFNQRMGRCDIGIDPSSVNGSQIMESFKDGGIQSSKRVLGYTYVLGQSNTLPLRARNSGDGWFYYMSGEKLYRITNPLHGV